VLGTDGFGRSDSRVKLREFFEVNRYYVTVAALKSLADEGKIPAFRRAGSDCQVRHRSEQAESCDPVMLEICGT
jgi:pyruvate dehydrogenase complex dehydrogenase (E1) component